MTIPTYNNDLTQCMKWMQNNAPNLQSLVNQKANWYQQFQTEFWEDWQANVFDLRTANPFGIMVWCIILGVPSQLFGLYGNAAAWAYGKHRQNYVWSGGGVPPVGKTTPGGNFAGGGRTTILNIQEARWALQLRYIALVSNGQLQFINYMLNWIFNGGKPWDFANSKYFYAADSTISTMTAPASNVSVYKTDWQGNQLQSLTPRTNLNTNSVPNATDPALTNMAAVINTLSAPDGSVTGAAITDTAVTGTHSFQEATVPIVAGKIYCRSIFISQRANRFANVVMDNGGTNGVWAQFDVSVGVIRVAATAFGTATAVNAGMVAYPGGWYRCWVSGILDAVNDTVCRRIVYDAGTVSGGSVWNPSYLGIANRGFGVWGDQFEMGSSPTPYIATSGAAVTVTDYTLNPATGLVTFSPAPLTGTSLLWTGSFNGANPSTQTQFGIGNGAATAFTLNTDKIYQNDWQGNQLLSSGPRTNLCPASQTVGGTWWGPFGVTVTSNAKIAPDGTTTASLLVATSLTGRVQLSSAITLLAQTIYTQSIDLAWSNSTNTRLSVYDGALATVIASVSVVWDVAGHPTIGTVTGAVGGAAAVLLTPLPNGYYRVSIPFSSGSFTSTKTTLYPDIINGTGGVYAWGCQTEIGSSPTSYIKTVSTLVTVTDYTLNALTGAVSMAVAPLTGAALTWTGNLNNASTAVPLAFGTGDGVTTAFTLTSPPGAVLPVANPLHIEYRIGHGMNLSSQFVNLLNSPQYGIAPQFAGSSYTAIVS